MNGTIIIRRTYILFSFAFHFAACQNTELINKYPEKKCDYSEFSDKTFNELINLKDTISVTIYNQFIGDTKAYYYRNGQKKVYYDIGRVSTTPIEVRGNNGNKHRIYNKVVPVCRVSRSNYTNIYSLHYSATHGSIEVIVLDKSGKMISGLTLVSGEINNKAKQLYSSKIRTTIVSDTYSQEKTSETPEGDVFIKKYKQRADGYFEEFSK